jgi:predicted dithiol-disulfide oxidoreductase (DUF899 family)
MAHLSSIQMESMSKRFATRKNDALDSLWNMLDLTPEGRGDFHPKLSYKRSTRVGILAIA